MNIMSIDPSLRSTGICISLGKQKPFCFSILNKGKTEGKSLRDTYDTIMHNLCKYNINIVLCEEYSFGNFGRSDSISTMAEIKGVIKLACFDQKCEILAIPIQTWKQFFKSLPPKTRKKQYISYAKETFKIGFNTTDEVDAYLMLLATYYIYKGHVKTSAQLKLKDRITNLGLWNT